MSTLLQKGGQMMMLVCAFSLVTSLTTPGFDIINPFVAFMLVVAGAGFWLMGRT